MAKFTFPVPGRKKHAPQVTVTAPPTNNKAQRILGATALNIDTPRSWDEASNSGMSVSISESTAATSYGSTVRGPSKNDWNRRAAVEREWGDESEILPRQLRLNGLPEDDDDYRSEMSSVLRKRQSNSTLVSYYDKAKQPLSISQQTSASAMAKGLPTKAHKMLDVDNAQAAAKAAKKKKPAKLDFTQIMSRTKGSKKDNQQQIPWEGPILAPDHVMKSPSLMSPLTPPPNRGRVGGRLQKKSTKESLRSLRSMQSEPSRPLTSGSNRRGQHHLNGLPNLYEHYEQMSFRQVMGDYQPPEEEPMPKQKPRLVASETHLRHRQLSNPPVPKLPEHLQPSTLADERIISQYAQRNLPQTPQGDFAKIEQSSPTDCAASISSRHTRTSKASKRTDRSFQDSDLLEKSVLSLSSDSEDDVYADSSLKSPVSSVPGRRPSDASSAVEYRPATSRTTESEGKRLSRSSKGSKRASFAPVNTYLTIPHGHPKMPPINARSSSLSGSSANTIQEASSPRSADPSPSRESTMSTTSTNTTMTWQSRTGYGVQEARAITMLPAQGPAESESEAEQELDSSDLQSCMPDSLTPSADQPTPPLSPSSVDFYIRSAHSSIDGHGSHNRFMAVTRQEEMLLAALRHKRQIMRETILSEFTEEGKDKRQPKGHISKPSEATITESNFEFDFPAPPTHKDRNSARSNGTAIIDVRSSLGRDSVQADKRIEIPIASPKPKRPTEGKSILKKSHRESSEDDGHERILLYLDRPIAQEYHIEPSQNGEPSPDISDFMEEFDEDESSDSEVVSEVVVYAQQRRQSDHRGRHSQPPKPRSGRSSLNAPAPKFYRASEAEPIIEEEVGVPRPDSPISPEGLGAPPPKKSSVNKKTARLSAVGPARWGDED